VFKASFLIADVRMKAQFPTERWFWFDPPSGSGASQLLHRQPEDVWRIDFQIGWDADRNEELKPENVRRRVTQMLGEGVEFDIVWSSIYTFQCRRMRRFRQGRVVFAGDAAHQVSPFGARGANSGLQDAENLAWKLDLVLRGQAGEGLIDSYEMERIQAADENIRNSTRSTDFIAPKTPMRRAFRDAVLHLSAKHEFARPLVNSGRLSVPCIHDGSPLNGPDALPGGPARARPGAPAPDAPLGDGFLLDKLNAGFALLAIDTDAPDVPGVPVIRLTAQDNPDLAARYLGDAPGAVYLIRPDQHVVARWAKADADQIAAAIARAKGDL
jgi:3-(3-hydroxy-phenyl)propionate hydroxylase